MEKDIKNFRGDNIDEFNNFFHDFRNEHKTMHEDLHYWMINLYNNYSIDSSLFLDGIIKRYISFFLGKGKIIKYAFLDLLDQYKNKLPYKYFPWSKVIFYFDDNEKNNFGVVASQESNSINNDIVIGYNIDECYEHFDVKMKNCCKELSDLDLARERVFWEYLAPLFIGYETKEGQIFDGSKFYSHYERRVLQFEKLVFIPYFDAFIDNDTCGALLGNLLIIPFEESSKKSPYLERKKFIKESFNEFKKLFQILANTFFDSRSQDILRSEIKFNHDFLQDFIGKTAYVQDWNKIMVYSSSQNNLKLRYCFRRFEGGKDRDLPIYQKTFELCDDIKTDKCEACKFSHISDELNDRLNNRNLMENKIIKLENDKYLYCLDLDKIFDNRVLPSLDVQDSASYRDNILCFEFPDDIIYPEKYCSEKEEAVEKLGDYYITRLIPIFDKLLLKRKVLNHSIKSAVAAIMSRNMSHNIGSHILSRIEINEIEKRLPKRQIPDMQDEQNDIRMQICGHLLKEFHIYIQKKNDFLAEISTEPYRSSRSVMLFKDVILPFSEEVLLLDYIARNEGIEYKNIRINFFVKSNKCGSVYRHCCPK